MLQLFLAVIISGIVAILGGIAYIVYKELENESKSKR